MEQITGRVVRDAVIKKTNDGKELVAFTVVVNDRYKPKGKDEVKEARFFECAYFLGTNVKSVLRKGAVVSVFGRVNLNAYKGSDGEYHANLTFHTSLIDVIAKAKQEASAQEAVTAGNAENKDDLPF